MRSEDVLKVLWFRVEMSSDSSFFLQTREEKLFKTFWSLQMWEAAQKSMISWILLVIHAFIATTQAALKSWDILIQLRPLM